MKNGMVDLHDLERRRGMGRNRKAALTRIVGHRARGVPRVADHGARGFTLIELLVVIAVIAIIAAILFPVFAAARRKAYQTTCLSNLKQIGAATMMYISDYDNTFPFVLNFSGNGAIDANYGDDGNHPVVRGVTGTEPQFRLVTLVSPYV